MNFCWFFFREAQNYVCSYGTDESLSIRMSFETDVQGKVKERPMT